MGSFAESYYVRFCKTTYYYKELVDPIPIHTIDELMQGIC